MIDTSVALSFCLANASPVNECKTDTTVIGLGFAKIKKASATKKAKTTSAPIVDSVTNKKPAPVIPTFYPIGTLDAESFLVALRRSKDRNECIQAIAAYIGYDLTKPYGEQDSNARRQAQLKINPVKPLTVPFARGSLPSVNGFIAGMPDHKERHIQNLLARERAAVSAMIANEELSRNSLSDHDRTLYAGLALVEQDRLAEIRADIARSL